MDIQSEKIALLKMLEKINDESLLKAIKSLVDYANKRDEEYLGTSVEQYNRELDEANARIEGGEYVSHSDLDKQSSEW